MRACVVCHQSSGTSAGPTATVLGLAGDLSASSALGAELFAGDFTAGVHP